MLRAYFLDFEGSWDEHLALAEFSYNNSYQSGIQMAPFEAFMEGSVGRKFVGLQLGKVKNSHQTI